MKQEILRPDYNNSILNLITSILKNYNVETKYSSLNKIDELMKYKYKNIVLVVLDGMGENIIKRISPNGLFYKNKIDNITSVYPSTTTSAMNTYYSGKPPLETGWIAWSQYFKEYGRAIDVFPCTDSYTGEKINCEKFKIKDILKYKTVYEQIEEINSNIKTYEIMPADCERKTKISVCADDIDGMCTSIVSLCKNTENKFIMAYNDNPDSIIHKYGCYSNETKDFILETEKRFEKMVEELKGTDTILIISADHGHNDIKETINILELSELQECFIMPPFLESRLISFFIKQEMKEEFKNRFNKLFEDKYILYTKKEFLDSSLLGFGEKHKKIDDFIGDYIAIAVSDTIIKLGTFLSKEKKDKMSTHCGLTKNEMEVPLIVFDFK